jgi:hypothetical protein
MTEPIQRIELEVSIDYGQVYIFDPTTGDTPGSDAMDLVMDEAINTATYIGSRGGFIDLMTPIQFNTNAPMRVELWEQAPPDDDINFDHVVDVDLDVPSGRLLFEQSGETYDPEYCVETTIPPARYRVRVAGRGYEHNKSQGGGLDSYRLQLWLRETDTPAVLRRSWAGWQKIMG